MARDSSDNFIHGGGAHHQYFQMQSEPPFVSSSSHSFRQGSELTWIFDELPNVKIVSVSRPDASDITPALLSYTIEFQYKQFKWQLLKKASQVFFLHFALKKRVIIEEIQEKQEQVKEWLQNLGIGDHATVVQDEDEVDDDAEVPQHEENYASKNRDVPSSAAFPMIKPALGRQQSISDRAKVAMQGYLNHFMGNLNIVNSREVCKFLEVSKLSFLPEYGPKLKEDFVMVRHLPKIQKDDGERCCCGLFGCCNNNWQKVWAVLKPGFLALLEDPFETKLLDIIVFDVLPPSDGNGEGRVSLATEIKERNPLRYGLTVSCGNRTIKLRTKSKAKVRDWVASINDAGLRPPEGWCYPHRFGAFAPPRGLTEDGSQAQWFIDGQAAFEAIASSIEEAKSEVFITDWWLCPELYLRRPFNIHGSSRLDALLEAKAKQGVQVYILLYKEVALALKINSVYSKRRLLNIHENVKVLRYPDHFSTGVYLWSHHEKIVIVDYEVCYIGGLDLCFGRYDNHQHNVGDLPALVWPGKDYYNPRESEPNSWEDTMKDELDREKYPRMPWHDVHCALWGPPCRDVARHFVQRWNYAKRNKAPNEQAIPLLMPQHHMVIPHYMGKTDAVDKSKENENHGLKRQDSFTSRSSSQDIPLLFPQEADEKVVTDEDATANGLDMNHNLSDQRKEASWNHFSYKRLKFEPPVADMQMEDFVDNHGTNPVPGPIYMDALTPHNDEWWETQERGELDASLNEGGQVGPCTSCRCQIIRSVGPWSAGTSQTEDSIHNAYCSLIEKAEHFIYIEVTLQEAERDGIVQNQFFISGLSGDDIIRNRVLEALYRRILHANNEKKCFRVIIVIPLLPGFQGGIDDGGAASVRAILHWQYRTICRGQNSILKNLYDAIGPKAHEYISFYGLRSYGRLRDGGLLATSQVYVHSKVMIVDDRAVLVGSANINDRSLLGSRDSEIGVLIEDKEFVGSYMNGSPWKAGRFAYSLRISLWCEHLGLHPSEGFGFQEDMMFCGMFDGHGPWGHYVSKRVRDSLPSALLCQWQKGLALTAVDSNIDYECSKSNSTFDVWKNCYLRTYALVDKELDQHQGFYSFSSGTTSLAILKQGDMIVLANVGDSRAVLGRTSEDGSIVAVQMTVDCKPDVPQEAERIRQSRGEVFCLPDEPGVYRIWSPTHETPGLSTSRAFGDYCLKDYGMTSTPEVTQWHITERDKFIVLATDGVWDVLSNQEAVEVVSSAEQKETSAKILVESAVNAWKRRRPGLAADDCSAICLFFQSSSPRRQNNLVDSGTKNKGIVSPSGLVSFGR